MRVGSLFAGIGGFDLGLERTGGFQTAWFCEQDPYCQRVLAKHWPDAPCYPDITELKAAHVEPVDVLCGGFPCQDLSIAGKGAGLAGARSGLWTEYARLIGELRPRYVIVENVSALLARGLGTVLGDLAALGYDAEWDCIPASAVGAPHQRDRVWLVAYPQCDELRQQPGRRGGQSGTGPALAAIDGSPQPVADADAYGREQGVQLAAGTGQRPGSRDAERGGTRQNVAHTEGKPIGAGLRTHEEGGVGRGRSSDCGGTDRVAADANRVEHEGSSHALRRPAGAELRDQWAVEPDVGRVAHGVPARVDRLRALGNALVPQIAEWIGWRILEHEGLAEVTA